MARSIIAADGSIIYRTVLLPQTRAEAFAACLRSNNRFEAVDLKRSDRAKSERAFYVTFQPSSDARKDAMFMNQWDQRRIKGETEGMDYIFWADPDQKGSWWCFNPLSGNTYLVSIFSCDCPDYVVRCQKAGCLCKHQMGWTAQMAAGVLGKTDKVTPTPSAEPVSFDAERTARRARLSDSYNQDF